MGNNTNTQNNTNKHDTTNYMVVCTHTSNNTMGRNDDNTKNRTEKIISCNGYGETLLKKWNQQ